ncbi:unnamed protein product [Phytomonas sp. Hart1]|nr:unnamed protein product [Phytomonas sp. Hart1]|eukprot:CCW67097.1 unnamed protein product [Phytomonas sp. isolate Hart1]
MYRESLLGVALSATLEEISEKHPLTRDQMDHLWRIFDETMDSCLSEVPLMSRINVKVPALMGPTGGKASSGLPAALVSAEPGPEETPSPSPLADRESAWQIEEDDATVFPVYRMVDGLWTILLKDPIVQVRDEFGTEAEVRLDYLKVYLKDPSQRKLRRRRV